MPDAVPIPVTTPAAESQTGLSFGAWATLFAGSGFIHQDIMMGSEAPIDVNPQAILERLRQRTVSEYFGSAGVDVESLLRPYLAGPWRSDGQWPMNTTSENLNTDLYPRDEFEIPPLVTLPGLQ